jgi:hypothetical protein
VKGRPLRPWLLGFRAGIASAALAAALAYASLALLAARLSLAALAAWVLSGFFAGYSAFVSSDFSFRLVSTLADALNARDALLPRRPLADPHAALAYSTIAPPVAAVIMLFNSRWLVDAVHSVLVHSGTPEGEVARWLVERGLAGEEGVKGSTYLLGATILGLPYTVSRHYRWLLIVACAALQSSPGWSSLRDKPCTQDFIEVMVWGELDNSTLNSKLLAEKWSIQD